MAKMSIGNLGNLLEAEYTCGDSNYGKEVSGKFKTIKLACEYGLMSEIRSFGIQNSNYICRDYRGKEPYADYFMSPSCRLNNALKDRAKFEKYFNERCFQKANCTFDFTLD